MGREGGIFKLWRRKKRWHCSGLPNMCVGVFQAKKGYSWQKAQHTRGQGTRVHGDSHWGCWGMMSFGQMTWLHTTEPGSNRKKILAALQGVHVRGCFQNFFFFVPKLYQAKLRTFKFGPRASLSTSEELFHFAKRIKHYSPSGWTTFWVDMEMSDLWGHRPSL